MPTELPPLPKALTEVAVAGYHDGTLRPAMEDYYDAEQMREYAQAAIALLTAGPEREGGEAWEFRYREVTWLKWSDWMPLESRGDPRGKFPAYTQFEYRVAPAATPQSAPGVRALPAKWRAEADTFSGYTTAPHGLTWDHGAADAKRDCARQLEAALASGQSAAGAGPERESEASRQLRAPIVDALLAAVATAGPEREGGEAVDSTQSDIMFGWRLAQSRVAKQDAENIARNLTAKRATPQSAPGVDAALRLADEWERRCDTPECNSIHRRANRICAAELRSLLSGKPFGAAEAALASEQSAVRWPPCPWCGASNLKPVMDAVIADALAATPQSAPGVDALPAKWRDEADYLAGRSAHHKRECANELEAALASGQSAAGEGCAHCFVTPTSRSDYSGPRICWKCKAEEPAGEGWQPIATAPKEVDVLVYCFGAAIPHRVAMQSPTGGEQFVWLDTGCSRLDTFPPTHWRPLPAAPAAQAKEEGRG